MIAVLQYALYALPASALLIVGTALIAAAIRWRCCRECSRQLAGAQHHVLAAANGWPTRSRSPACMCCTASMRPSAPFWYRLLGAKIGRNAEISTAMGLIPTC